MAGKTQSDYEQLVADWLKYAVKNEILTPNTPGRIPRNKDIAKYLQDTGHEPEVFQPMLDELPEPSLGEFTEQGGRDGPTEGYELLGAVFKDGAWQSKTSGEKYSSVGQEKMNKRYQAKIDELEDKRMAAVANIQQDQEQAKDEEPGAEETSSEELVVNREVATDGEVYVSPEDSDEWFDEEGNTAPPEIQQELSGSEPEAETVQQGNIDDIPDGERVELGNSGTFIVSSMNAYDEKKWVNERTNAAVDEKVAKQLTDLYFKRQVHQADSEDEGDAEVQTSTEPEEVSPVGQEGESQRGSSSVDRNRNRIQPKEREKDADGKPIYSPTEIQQINKIKAVVRKLDPSMQSQLLADLRGQPGLTNRERS